MRIWPRGGAHSRRIRLLLAALALGLGASVGTVAAPSPAAAFDPPWIIPPGGWCYYSWYAVSANQGVEHQRYSVIPVLSFTNSTSTSALWSEQFQVQTTFTSTVTTSTEFQGGIDLGIIKVSVQHSTQVVTVTSVTVNQTTGFQTQVLPFSTKYAQYGTWRQVTSGTYYQSQHECGTMDYETVTSGPLTAKLVRANDPVGWWLQDSL